MPKKSANILLKFCKCTDNPFHDLIQLYCKNQPCRMPLDLKRISTYLLDLPIGKRNQRTGVITCFWKKLQNNLNFLPFLFFSYQKKNKLGIKSLYFFGKESLNITTLERGYKNGLTTLKVFFESLLHSEVLFLNGKHFSCLIALIFQYCI